MQRLEVPLYYDRGARNCEIRQYKHLSQGYEVTERIDAYAWRAAHHFNRSRSGN
jgi:hypothetical protein